MIPILLIAQSLAVILLGAVGLFPDLQKPGGGLNRNGCILLALGAVGFVAATVFLQVLNNADAEKKQRHIEDLIDKYFSATAEFVMATPKGPSIPFRATPEDVIAITGPRDGTAVDRRDFIEGTASSNLSGDVWVVVHPMDTSSYWVQPRVSVRSGGAWSGLAYFGRPGDLDVGKRFEVVAIADPHDTLQEGEYGSTWPSAKWASKPVTLVRR